MASEAAKRIAARIQEETFMDGNYEIPSQPSDWLKETAEILTEEIAATIERCAQIADAYHELNGEVIAAAIRSMGSE